MHTTTYQCNNLLNNASGVTDTMQQPGHWSHVGHGMDYLQHLLSVVESNAQLRTSTQGSTDCEPIHSTLVLYQVTFVRIPMW